MLRRNDFACKRLEVFIVFHLPVMFPAAGASGRLLGFEFFPDEEGRLPEFDGRVKKDAGWRADSDYTTCLFSGEASRRWLIRF